MSYVRDLPFHDRPSNCESFQAAPVSNQSLIDLLNDKLAGGVDKIELSTDQVRDIIQGLREPEKLPPTDKSESGATKELAVLKHHCRLGDYAGRIFNDLKLHNTDAPLPKLATELAELLGEEVTNGPMAQAIEVITYRIRNQGADIDSDMAKFAVKAYAARNQVCHGEAGNLVIAEKWDDLAQRISSDLETLPEILPEDQIEQLENWRRILCYYRDRYIVQDSSGKWQKREEESLVQLPDTVYTPCERSFKGLPPLLAEAWFNKGHFRADLVQFSSSRLLAGRERAGSLPSVKFSKRKASGPPEGDSAPEPPSKKPKKLQDPKSPPTTEQLHEKAVLDLFSQIKAFSIKAVGKSLPIVQNTIREVKFAHELYETEQTAAAAMEDGAEREMSLQVSGEEEEEKAGDDEEWLEGVKFEEEWLEGARFEGEVEEGEEEEEVVSDDEEEGEEALGFWAR